MVQEGPRAAGPEPMNRTRAAGALPTALPAALLVVLLCVLGAFAPASHGTPASGSPDAAGGPAAAGTFLHHDATDESADDVCTSAACGTQPRLHRDTPAERFAGPTGVAWVPLCLLLPLPAHGTAPPPSPDTAAQAQHTVCQNGRAPPPSPGI